MTCCSSSTLFSAIGFSSFVEGFDDAAAGAAGERVGEADAEVVDDGDAEKAGKEEGDGGRGTEAVVAEEAGKEEGDGGRGAVAVAVTTGVVVDERVEECWQKRLSSRCCCTCFIIRLSNCLREEACGDGEGSIAGETDEMVGANETFLFCWR